MYLPQWLWPMTMASLAGSRVLEETEWQGLVAEVPRKVERRCQNGMQNKPTQTPTPPFTKTIDRNLQIRQIAVLQNR